MKLGCIVSAMMLAYLLAGCGRSSTISEKSKTDGLARGPSGQSRLQAIFNDESLKNPQFSVNQSPTDTETADPFWQKLVTSERTKHIVVAINQGDYHGALKLIELDSTKGQSRFDLVYLRLHCLLSLGRSLDAIDTLDELRQFPSDTPKLHFMTGAVYAAARRFDDAIAEYGKAIAQDSKDFGSFANRAACWLEKKDFSRASQDAEQAIRFSKGQNRAVIVAVYNCLLEGLNGAGEFRKAVEMGNRALSLDPRGLGGCIFYQQSVAYEKLGEKDRSEHCQNSCRRLGYGAGPRFDLEASGITADPASRKFKYRWDTKHLTVLSNYGADALVDYADTGEILLSVLSDQFIDLTDQYPINIFVLEDCDKLNKFLREDKNEEGGSFLGICFERYIAAADIISVGTLAHELTHKVCLDQLDGRMETWAEEGLPELFEKFYGYRDGDNCVVYFGQQNPLRLHQSEIAKIKRLKLADIVRAKKGYASEIQSKRLASVFLYKLGKLTNYTDYLAMGNKRGYQTYFEAACGRSFKELEPAWKEYIREVVASIPIVERYPMSRIYPSKAEFDDAAKKYRFDLSTKPITVALGPNVQNGPASNSTTRAKLGPSHWCRTN